METEPEGPDRPELSIYIPEHFQGSASQLETEKKTNFPILRKV